MKVYEMIYSKGFQESTKLLFDINNEKSRKFFLEMMREDIRCELIDFEESCKSDYKGDLLKLYKEVWVESNIHLDFMENEFIEKGEAYFFDNIFLIVRDKVVICF